MTEVAKLRAERDHYRRLTQKVGDVLCTNGTHAAKIREIWTLLLGGET